MSDSGHNAVSSNMQDDAVINTVILRTPHSGMVRQWRSARLQNFINAQWIRVAHSWKTTRANSVQWKYGGGKPSPCWSRSSGGQGSMEGGAQADQRAAALPTAVPLCRHHDQAVSVGPGTVRIHTIRMHLDVPMAWQQRVSMRPRPLFLVHGPVVVAGLTALRLLPREHPDHGSCRCGWCPFSNRKRGNGPSLDTSIRRAPDR